VSEKEQYSKYETQLLHIHYFITKHQGYEHMFKFEKLCIVTCGTHSM